MYELPDVEALSSGVLGSTPLKQLTISNGKMVKSTGSALGVDEIDSECRTEDGELHTDANKESQ